MSIIGSKDLVLKVRKQIDFVKSNLYNLRKMKRSVRVVFGYEKRKQEEPGI